ncbi:helix-turn-helix transcriptional regulator [Streptomyces sp. DSM 40484]|jgi:DNA-binding CsgD family transcriptional regulator|uniref:helix-turn-helix transcriptional regulator n=1 Tax=Streptomyces kroppenstedtii TaxID=3051181 RepID=UPI0028D0F733|nr:LuxR C-terminal-related transcriptional regulator [Streptomyces sp. DSM 40484]
MSTVLNAERRGRQAHFEGPDFERVSVLQGRLRALDRAAEDADTVVAACLVWVADALMDIAAESGDPHSTNMLLDEASAALAAVPPADPGRPDLATPAGLLTEREHAVLVRLQEDAPLRQIGAELFVSHNTVKSHVRAVYRKLRVSSRTDAVARARQLGLL